ncbi:AraC family transcriptional regulator [Paenibacillus sp. sgz302251]|uniref:helix-turn-helix transcriptional regulator n=1 Tax=Paenibacillus sp. sgz302251 TaxID=3414493 RepID=UPI003C7C2BC4
MKKNTVWCLLEGNPLIHTMGRIKASNVHPRRAVSFWVLGIVYSGTRTIKMGETHLRLTTGDYFLLPPDVPHSGIEIDTHNVFFVHFHMHGTKLYMLPDRFCNDDLLLPIAGQLPDDLDLFAYIDYLERRHQLEDVGPAFLNTQLKALLYQISTFMKRRHTDAFQGQRIADGIFQYIADHYSSELKSEDFEKQFHLSYRQLNNLFKKQFNTTIHQKMIDLKIHHAYNLLIHGESITAAAAKTGFNDYFYFLKCFKRKMGITPKQLVKKYFV